MDRANRLAHGDPEVKEVLPGFLESASSLCDMMSTTIAAVLNEIMSILADEACGADYGARSGGASTAAAATAPSGSTPRWARPTSGRPGSGGLLLPDRPPRAVVEDGLRARRGGRGDVRDGDVDAQGGEDRGEVRGPVAVQEPGLEAPRGDRRGGRRLRQGVLDSAGKGGAGAPAGDGPHTPQSSTQPRPDGNR